MKFLKAIMFTFLVVASPFLILLNILLAVLWIDGFWDSIKKPEGINLSTEEYLFSLPVLVLFAFLSYFLLRKQPLF